MGVDEQETVEVVGARMIATAQLFGREADAGKIQSLRGNNIRKRSMARPVDYRKGRGSKGVHTEDETVPLGKKDQGRRSPPFDQAGAAESARARPAGQGKHDAGHESQKSGRKKK